MGKCTAPIREYYKIRTNYEAEEIVGRTIEKRRCDALVADVMLAYTLATQEYMLNRAQCRLRPSDCDAVPLLQAKDQHQQSGCPADEAATGFSQTVP